MVFRQFFCLIYGLGCITSVYFILLRYDKKKNFKIFFSHRWISGKLNSEETSSESKRVQNKSVSNESCAVVFVIRYSKRSLRAATIRDVMLHGSASIQSYGITVVSRGVILHIEFHGYTRAMSKFIMMSHHYVIRNVVVFLLTDAGCCYLYRCGLKIIKLHIT